MTCDTRLSAEVLTNLGFQKHPEKPHWLLRRHGGYLIVVEVDDGWTLDGFRPVDVGDLLMMSHIAGQNVGRRFTVEEFLDTVEGSVVLNWACNNGLLPKVELPAVKPKPARKPRKKK